MSSVRKEQIKALKGPDQFQVKVMTVMDWGVKNVRLLLFAAVPLAVVIAGVFAFRYVESKRKDSRMEALGKVQVVYDAEARQAAEARQVIQKKLQDIDSPAAAKGKGEAPAVPAAQQILEKATLQKQMEAIKPNHAASAEQFLTYYKSNEAYPEGWMAGMLAARSLIDQNKLPEARGLLEGILTKAKGDRFYQTQAGLTLVGVMEEQGDYDQALATVDKLEKAADSELKPKMLLMRGQLLMLKGSKAEAKAALTTLVDTFGTSPEAQKARSFLALLTN